MIKNIIIAILLVFCVCREITNYNKMQWAIQNTSDELLAACESKIDEIESKCK